MRTILATVVLSLGLTLGGCGSTATDPSSAPSTTTADSPAPDEFPTEEPDPDSGDLGGGEGSGEGSGEEGGGGQAEGSIEVAGPTLTDDYPEYFGNIYPSQVAKGANFENFEGYDVTVEEISVDSPLVVLDSCTPDSGAAAYPPCSPGFVLLADLGSGCSAGAGFADGVDLEANYTPTFRWRLSMACTDATTGPCADPRVVERQPDPAHAVPVSWTFAEPMRYCGATDYADEAGAPGGFGGPPEDGCSETEAEEEPPPSEDASEE